MRAGDTGVVTRSRVHRQNGYAIGRRSAHVADGRRSCSPTRTLGAPLLFSIQTASDRSLIAFVWSRGSRAACFSRGCTTKLVSEEVRKNWRRSFKRRRRKSRATIRLMQRRRRFFSFCRQLFGERATRMQRTNGRVASSQKFIRGIFHSANPPGWFSSKALRGKFSGKPRCASVLIQYLTRPMTN